MITLRNSPVYVNQVKESWDQGGGVGVVTPSNNPFAQLGPTLDLVFAGVPTDPLLVSTLQDDTIDLYFVARQYWIAEQYVIWE
jgi:hypothetical protein